ncbi:4-diphosphocytidyl-2C-methyl-D-erythritol kinase [Limnochorda pilosa]|uniref:4-diphosphocytidyl-2-C-methyl-D-erythritol kinase n=2 Tax=Limnochorda pilosa TaxID=1555112 RepID=A0A0K2SQK3_LIMPI|nr:4-(cytidine 5'-diphospho)-2-C-methyl-D-erythritol kinase [Limnochorda pilosa]BAS29413.1 4-diphosphocytidyl-2C-methyl-D-erythritol kinase [Limnochorda pilosa]
MVLRAPAKVNLCLAVGPRRPDGYHPILSLAVAVDLEDRVEIQPAPALEVVCDDPAVPAGGANLAHRAAALLAQAAGREPRVRITIEKRIPVEAGLAGGSADAAAVLVGLSRWWGLDWGDEELARLGLRLGADVPFCLRGGAALMEGVGEQLTPLGDLPRLALVLASPRGARLSTAWAYQELDRARRQPGDLEAARGRIDGALAAWRRGDRAALGAKLFNDLEPVAYRALPELAPLAARMAREGALGVVVSGSGPTLVGLAAGGEAARTLSGTLATAGYRAAAVETLPGDRGSPRLTPDRNS